MPQRLVVTRGDDAASFPSANAAIAESFRRGVLRNAGVMACCPAFADAVRALRGLDGLCIGLHVTLSSEWDAPMWGPVLSCSEVPTLVEPGGMFTREPKDLHERAANLDEAMAEIRAQLAHLRQAGLEPRYIDEHMGVGWILGESVPGVGWVGGLRRRIAALAREEGLVDAARVPGVPVPKAGGDLVDRWIAGLEAMPPGSVGVLVNHPGLDAPDMRALVSPWHPPGAAALERDGDRLAWQDPRLVAAARRLDVRFIRYDEVPEALLQPALPGS
jgi:hypothetical protein